MGSGPAFGDVEDFFVQEQKRKDAKRRRGRKRDMTRLPTLDAEGPSKADTSSFRPRNILSRLGRASLPEGEVLTHRKAHRGPSSRNEGGDGIELQTLGGGMAVESNPTTSRASPPSDARTQFTLLNRAWNRHSRFSPVAALYGSWTTLRHAHHEAAQSQALEQIKIQEETGMGPGSSMVAQGWGWGAGRRRRWERAQNQLRELEAERPDLGLIADSSATGEGQSMMGDDDAVTLSRSSLPPEPQYPPPAQLRPTLQTGTGPWWWGPLRKWRLQDRTAY